MDTAYFIKVLGALFAIMNPFVNLPFFLSMTEGMGLGAQRKVAAMVALYCAGLGALVAVSGTQILDFFGITIDDFRVAGGIVLMMIALGMLNGHSAAHQGSRREQDEQSKLASFAFYPMAFPMLIGPGTITTLVVFTTQAGGSAQLSAVAIAFGATVAALFIVMFFAASIGHLMSATLRTIMTRLMGMILVAVAVGMIGDGIKEILPGLG